MESFLNSILSTSVDTSKQNKGGGFEHKDHLEPPPPPSTAQLEKYGIVELDGIIKRKVKVRENNRPERDSNSQPLTLYAGALPTELSCQMVEHQQTMSGVTSSNPARVGYFLALSLFISF